MPHVFTVRLDEDRTSIRAKIEALITTHGGKLQGDSEKGFFEGRTVLGPMKGEYQFPSDRELKITVTDKPFLVSYDLIESQLRKFFDQA